jgi:hypothetical protein
MTMMSPVKVSAGPGVAVRVVSWEISIVSSASAGVALTRANWVAVIRMVAMLRVRFTLSPFLMGALLGE